MIYLIIGLKIKKFTKTNVYWYMKEVNQQEEKRKVSSEKNKEYWKNLEYRKKMKKKLEKMANKEILKVSQIK